MISIFSQILSLWTSEQVVHIHDQAEILSACVVTNTCGTSSASSEQQELRLSWRGDDQLRFVPRTIYMRGPNQESPSAVAVFVGTVVLNGLIQHVFIEPLGLARARAGLPQ